MKRIVSIARSISKPFISKGKTYEVDKLCTYIRHKKNYIWLVYALEKNSKTVVSFNVGKPTNKTLSLSCKIMFLKLFYLTGKTL
ncbi:hypothetical protein [Flavobacterium pectinovorum]|uniref:hypothetical protein n=1 Tax=Flavobacterium pectinovorum TaxID=29533 RepID=UPI001F4F7993|nr:hypothetical protein [Flavobacterium pectinovorum]